MLMVTRPAYEYLRDEMRRQRGCSPLTQEQKDRIWKQLVKFWDSGDKVRLTNNSMGGGDGTYEGKWWSWTTEDLKSMLSEGGFSWEEK